MNTLLDTFNLRKLNQESGFILPTVLLISILFTLLSVNVSRLAVNNIDLASDDEYRVVAQLAADAGADYGITQLNADNEWLGSGGEIELFDKDDVRSTYEVTVTVDPVDDSIVTINTVGRSYKPAISTTPNYEREFNVVMRGVPNGGLFSLVTGVGGLLMRNSSKVIGGDVFVNGDILMENTAQIGTTSNPVRVEVAHQSCPLPPDSTYPTVCDSSIHGSIGEPITLNNSATIYGDVFATNQTASPNMINNGLQGPSAGPKPLPDIHDRDAQKAAVATTITASAANCTANKGSKTWPANVKITGNVQINKSCTVTTLGDVWITGDLTMTQGGEIQVDDSIGTNDLNIMVDGSNGVSLRNSSKVLSNSSSTGARMFTYYSDASCSPNCSTLTGQEQFDSKNITTFDLSQSADAPNTIFYAQWTQVTINNAGAIGAVVGQSIEMVNSSTITFGAIVSDPSLEKYVYVINRYIRL